MAKEYRDKDVSKMENNLHQRVVELELKEKEHEHLLCELQYHYDITNALNEILKISLLPISLNEQLTRILKLIVEIPWVTLEKKRFGFSNQRIK